MKYLIERCFMTPKAQIRTFCNSFGKGNIINFSEFLKEYNRNFRMYMTKNYTKNLFLNIFHEFAHEDYLEIINEIQFKKISHIPINPIGELNRYFSFIMFKKIAIGTSFTFNDFLVNMFNEIGLNISNLTKEQSVKLKNDLSTFLFECRKQKYVISVNTTNKKKQIMKKVKDSDIIFISEDDEEYMVIKQFKEYYLSLIVKQYLPEEIEPEEISLETIEPEEIEPEEIEPEEIEPEEIEPEEIPLDVDQMSDEHYNEIIMTGQSIIAYNHSLERDVNKKKEEIYILKKKLLGTGGIKEEKEEVLSLKSKLAEKERLEIENIKTIQKLQQNLLSTKTDYNASVLKEEEYKTLKNRIRMLEGEKKSNEEYTNNITQLKQLIERLQKENKTLKERHKHKLEELSVLNERKNEKIKDENEKLKKDVDKYRIANRNFINQVNKLNQKYNELQQQKRKKSINLEDFKQFKNELRNR